MPQKTWQKKIGERDYATHVKRLTEIRSNLDNSAPKTYTKSKKKETERRRQYAEIDRENRILLERLAKIMQQKTIDNENGSLQYQKSLSHSTRRTELERITEENQRLLKRIQEAEPCYNHLSWEEQAKAREIYLKNMSEFPETFEENRRRLLREKRESSSGSIFTPEGSSQMKRHGLLRPLSDI